MQHTLELENIQELRRQAGIEDSELDAAVHDLRVGDTVKLTFRSATKPSPGESLLIRITSIRGGAFRGKLMQKPAILGLANLRVGSLIRFTTAHIHSITGRQVKHEQ